MKNGKQFPFNLLDEKSSNGAALIMIAALVIAGIIIIFHWLFY